MNIYFFEFLNKPYHHMKMTSLNWAVILFIMAVILLRFQIIWWKWIYFHLFWAWQQCSDGLPSISSTATEKVLGYILNKTKAIHYFSLYFGILELISKYFYSKRYSFRKNAIQIYLIESLMFLDKQKSSQFNIMNAK